MPRIYIDNHLILSYDTAPSQKYWKLLSTHLIAKYGKGPFQEHQQVEEILLECFKIFTDEFKKLIVEEKALTFFLYTYWLHEQSIKLYFKTLAGTKLHTVDETEFAIYRRILKMTLEQGCDINLIWGEFPNPAEIKRIDNKIQELLYLGTWMYGFADHIAFQKMIEECNKISFDEVNLLMIDWQHHYGEVYNQLFPALREDYAKSTFDEKSTQELREAIENCFGINYDYAGGQIFHIKKHYRPDAPELQTIEPYILPINLAHEFAINKDSATAFYSGLTISRTNKLSVEDVIYKPHSISRYMFRPILVFNIDGQERALIGEEKFTESMFVLATNALAWKEMPKEWLTNECFKLFVDKKAHEHDKILEDKIEEVVKSKKLLYCRNIKKFRKADGTYIDINNEIAGEIDFIVINQELKIVTVADSKYNRARYDGVGYRTDYTNFSNKYEPKLQKKINWVKNNLDVVQEHLKFIYHLDELNILDYKVEGAFFINTPTFYMFNGNYKAITLKQFPDFIEGKYEYPEVIVPFNSGDGKMQKIQHPFFKKPLKGS